MQFAMLVFPFQFCFFVYFEPIYVQKTCITGLIPGGVEELFKAPTDGVHEEC